MKTDKAVPVVTAVGHESYGNNLHSSSTAGSMGNGMTDHQAKNVSKLKAKPHRSVSARPQDHQTKTKTPSK